MPAHTLRPSVLSRLLGAIKKRNFESSEPLKERSNVYHRLSIHTNTAACYCGQFWRAGPALDGARAFSCRVSAILLRSNPPASAMKTTQAMSLSSGNLSCCSLAWMLWLPTPKSLHVDPFADGTRIPARPSVVQTQTLAAELGNAKTTREETTVKLRSGVYALPPRSFMPNHVPTRKNKPDAQALVMPDDPVWLTRPMPTILSIVIRALETPQISPPRRMC